MVSPELTVDVPPQPWTGRFDGDGAEHRRWWQAVSPYAQPPAAVPAPVPTVILGFASDEGVRRNKGRTGAALAPAAIRSALGPLAFHLPWCWEAGTRPLSPATWALPDQTRSAAASGWGS